MAFMFTRHKGITAVEFIVGLIWLMLLLIAILTLHWVGLILWAAATPLILLVTHVLYRYSCQAIVWLDAVPCRKCGRVGDYHVELQERRRRWRCSCGALYSFSGPTPNAQGEGSSWQPYMRWKWWSRGSWIPVRDAGDS
jgi:hypothetical protein